MIFPSADAIYQCLEMPPDQAIKRGSDMQEKKIHTLKQLPFLPPRLFTRVNENP
ncbi:hypothetical protein IWX87_003616 [Polaromonas sp. CG_9.7]|uniref:hypothetical protein n=1 Tax=Polaromonas sp. CG_9.7 TaxID=2787732 RepID=UPI001A2A9BAB|nr:hypothetical protein [Polaromonas sp. CG_9.7]MBG6073835.1 hypothetical protein [Polaromonas sp. CG_9.7]MBG6115863.1 hypothetical protein [Polaromonas sp. CG_9.2]